MSIWYRTHNALSAKIVFSGDGGLFTAGRWNHKGRKVTYCSNSIALCTLEWLAHNGLSVSDFSYFKFSINIPNSLIKTLTIKEIPKDWKKSPSSNATRDFSEEHLFNQTNYLAIAVPSVMIPEEYNLVINPLHINFQEITSSIKELGKYAAPKR